MTHAELVDRACYWLATAERCPVVVGEMVSGCAETPDAFGIGGSRTILVECKASRADFLADGKKGFRIRPDLGLGDFRFYLAPPGVIRDGELPAGWGLLVPHGVKSARVVHRSHAEGCGCRSGQRRAHHCMQPFKGASGERLLLTSLIRRLAGPGVRGAARCRIAAYTLDEKGNRLAPQPEGT